MLWSSAQDSIRIAAFLAIRKLASAGDITITDHVLKVQPDLHSRSPTLLNLSWQGTYLTLIRSSKSTSVHTLPSINLMKNSASEIFCMDYATTYQHAFGFIRQLAIHLRNTMKVKTKVCSKNLSGPSLTEFVRSGSLQAGLQLAICPLH